LERNTKLCLKAVQYCRIEEAHYPSLLEEMYCYLRGLSLVLVDGPSISVNSDVVRLYCAAAYLLWLLPTTPPLHIVGYLERAAELPLEVHSNMFSAVLLTGTGSKCEIRLETSIGNSLLEQAEDCMKTLHYDGLPFGQRVPYGTQSALFWLTIKFNLSYPLCLSLVFLLGGIACPVQRRQPPRHFLDWKQVGG